MNTIPEWIIARLGLEKAEEFMDEYGKRLPNMENFTDEQKEQFFAFVETMNNLDRLKEKILAADVDTKKKLKRMDSIATLAIGVGVLALTAVITYKVVSAYA